MIYQRSNVQLFLFSCLMAIIVVLLGLRWYFSQAEVDKRLSYTVSGATFETVIGQSHIDADTQTLQVSADSEQPNSLIRLSGLNVEADLYARVEIVFAEKASQQALTLTTQSHTIQHWQRQQAAPIQREQSILYTDEQTVSRFDTDTLTTQGAIIDRLVLSTSRLMIPYRLQAVRFVPKRYDMLQLLSLLWHDFTRISPNHLHRDYYLLPAKLLLILYFSVVFLIYVTLLLRAKRSIINAWWWVLIVAWALLDVRHLFYRGEAAWQTSIITAEKTVEANQETTAESPAKTEIKTTSKTVNSTKNMPPTAAKPVAETPIETFVNDNVTEDEQ